MNQSRARVAAMAADVRSGPLFATKMVLAIPTDNDGEARIQLNLQAHMPAVVYRGGAFKEQFMVFESEHSRRLSGRQSYVAESIADHRARLAREEEEKQQRRLEARAGQVSVVNTPSERISIWERLHGLPLPRTPTHKLVGVIAAATDLQPEQVQEVQRLRFSVAHGISAETAPILPKY